MTVQRRLMLRLAAALAMKRHGLAIFNGEAWTGSLTDDGKHGRY